MPYTGLRHEIAQRCELENRVSKLPCAVFLCGYSSQLACTAFGSCGIAGAHFPVFRPDVFVRVPFHTRALKSNRNTKAEAKEYAYGSVGGRWSALYDVCYSMCGNGWRDTDLRPASVIRLGTIVPGHVPYKPAYDDFRGQQNGTSALFIPLKHAHATTRA